MGSLMTAFLKLCYLQKLPHNSGTICPLSLIPTSPDALTCMSPVLHPAGYLRGFARPPPLGDLTKGDPASARVPGARCYTLLLIRSSYLLFMVRYTGSMYRRHAARYLWGLFRKVKRALYESSIRKKAACLTCISDGVHWPCQQSVSRMRQGHNHVLVFTWRHAFTSDSVIDVYVNVFGGGL